MTLLPKNILILAAALLLGARPASAQQVQVLEHDTAEGEYNSLVQVDADTYALAYSGADSDGFLKTFTISADGMTITQVQVLEHDTAEGKHNSLVRVDADTYALAYSGADSDGFLKTFTISADGMTITQVQVLEHDTNRGQANSLVRVDADTYALAYRGANDGFLKTFTISADGMTITQVQVLEHDTSLGQNNSLVQVDADTYALAYRGANDDGFLKTFTISADGMTITQVQVLEHDTAVGTDNSLVQVDADTYALAYSGAGSDGFLKTFTITADCPPDLVLSNQTMSGTQVFRSASTMTFGPNMTVPSGTALTLRSRTIRLEAGVSIQLGATFTANTDPDPCGTEVDEVLAKDRVRVFAAGAAGEDEGEGGSNLRMGAGVYATAATGGRSRQRNKGGDEQLLVAAHTFLLIDEDSIDHATPPNFFSELDVNADMAEIGLRERLLFFADHPGAVLTLPTGEVGDEGWFALKTVPASWAAVGRTGEGLRNYLNADPGLGTPDRHGNPEALLAQIPDVTPLRASGLRLLTGKQVCAVVYDQDVQVTYAPLTGSLQGATLGIVAFEILAVTESTASAPAALPQVEIQLLDADRLCAKELALFLDAPEPFSSSAPFDVVP